MVNNAASYYNKQSDMYRTVKEALRSNDKTLEEIRNTLVDIKDLLTKAQGKNNE